MSQIHTEQGKESGAIEDHQFAPRRPGTFTNAGNGRTREKERRAHNLKEAEGRAGTVRSNQRSSNTPEVE